MTYLIVFLGLISIYLLFFKKKKSSNLKVFLLFLIILILIIYILYYLNIIPHKKYTDSDFNIKTYISNIDKDNDGIDDATDIISSVKAYLKTKPQYQSKYYATGYPNDNYGVCTDVVAFGLLGAGYDLRELINNDIKANRNKYNIEVVDKNIDFRRVENIKVYLENNAITLTTDLKDISSWQRGDIVVFKKHIGIISEHRNKNGIPFVYHHASKSQKHYEEDILKSSNIVGHYRIS